jgi:hypothetical protein
MWGCVGAIVEQLLLPSFHCVAGEFLAIQLRTERHVCKVKSLLLQSCGYDEASSGLFLFAAQHLMLDSDATHDEK